MLNYRKLFPKTTTNFRFHNSNPKEKPKCVHYPRKPNPDEELFPKFEDMELDPSDIFNYNFGKKMYVILLLTSSLTMSFLYLLGRPKCTENGIKVTDEFSHLPKAIQYIKRAYSEYQFYKQVFKESAMQKVLPDLVEIPHVVTPQYTLVLEFNDVLAHEEWNGRNGWRYKKRPGLDHFLKTISDIYEIIIFTPISGTKIFPILKQLDPNHCIKHTLTTNSMEYQRGKLLKDLTKLNRDLTKTIVIDYTSETTLNHLENVLEIPRWKGNVDDLTLIYLANFLLAISQKEIQDVRKVINYYNQFPDPLAVFRERQKHLVDVAEVGLTDKEPKPNMSDPLLTYDYDWLKFP